MGGCEISVGVLLFHNFDFVIIIIESLCQFDTQVLLLKSKKDEISGSSGSFE